MIKQCRWWRKYVVSGATAAGGVQVPPEAKAKYLSVARSSLPTLQLGTGRYCCKHLAVDPADVFNLLSSQVFLGEEGSITFVKYRAHPLGCGTMIRLLSVKTILMLCGLFSFHCLITCFISVFFYPDCRVRPLRRIHKWRTVLHSLV